MSKFKVHIKSFSKNFHPKQKTKFPSFEKFSKQIMIFMPDLSLEWFQLSFDTYIVYVGKECEFSKISASKIAKFL